MQGNGLPLRTDDHGNTAATATALSGTAVGGVVAARAQGVVERPTDVDVFAFTAAAGSATITLSPAARSPNLDALVTVRNAAGTALATVNPVDAVNAGATVTLPAAGTYYVFVQGTGKGDPKTTGYSSYGSIGQYALSASYSTAVNQAPVARITTSTVKGTAPLAVNFSGTGSTDADGSIVSYAWSFGDGGTATGATASRTYATPGSYAAQLTVTDNGGITNASSVTITVDAPVVIPVMRVADIAMGLKSTTLANQVTGTAAVRLVDGSGAPVVGATVRGNWSGLVSAIGQSAITDGTGVARFTSTPTRQRGTLVFTVTGVSHASYTYAPATNTETTDSIQR
jgi:PKD repeat protein